MLPKSLLAVCLCATAVYAQESSSSLQQPQDQSQMQATEAAPPSEDVLAAEAAIAKADWKTAETKLTPWTAAHPEDARALFDLGYVADAQNRTDDAAENYRRAIAANPKSFEAHLSLGLLLARKNWTEDARNELLSATELDPGAGGPALKAKAWRALARIDRQANPQEASKELIEALRLSTESEDDTLLAASIAEAAGQADEAESAYKRLLQRDAKNALAQAGLAHLLIARKQYAEAETLLRSALEKSPADMALTAELATVLAAENKAEALPLLETLHKAHPADEAVTRMLAEVRAEAGDIAGSDLLYAKLLETTPEDATLLVAHGQNLVRLGKLQEAYALFDKATKIDPASGDAWSGLAFAASKAGKPEVTVHALTERSKFMPENASTYFLWATAYDALRQKPQAVAYYHHFLEAASGKYPNQEWQARQRLQLLEK